MKTVVIDGKPTKVSHAQYKKTKYDSTLPLSRGQRFSKKAVSAALKAANGMITVAARRMGCSVPTVRNYLKRYPELQQELVDIRDSYVDLAESSLLKQVQEKNTSATIFLLRCLGKKRGWIESPTVQLHAHAEAGSGTWADIMKRVASECGGEIKPSKDEIARVIDIVQSVPSPDLSASACKALPAAPEDEDEDGED